MVLAIAHLEKPARWYLHNESVSESPLPPYRRPIPVPSPETKPFWEAAKRHELWLQKCHDCGLHYFYPRSLCPGCWSPSVSWEKVSGRGTVYTYAINYRPGAPGFVEECPYVTAIVELREGPRLLTNLVGIAPDPQKIRIGMEVEVIFEDITEEIALPKFRPAARSLASPDVASRPPEGAP